MMTYTSKNSNGLFSLPKLVGQDGLFCDGDWIESKDQDPAGDVRLVQMMDIGDGEYLDKSSRFLTKQKAQELRCTFLRKGDILISRMPDPLGRACIFPGDSRQCVTAVDVCIVRPDSKLVDIRWLLHKINSPEFRHEINKWTTGTTRQRISRTNLGEITFPLPPLAEQKRIAAILDKADAIRRKRQQAIQLADEFLCSAFLDMFGDPVTNNKEWDSLPIKDLGTVVTGTTPPSKNSGMFGGEMPFITPGDLENGGSVQRFVTEQGAKHSRVVRKGATFVCCIGATIGKVGIAETRSAFNQQINAVEWGEAVDDMFGYWTMRFLKYLVIKRSITTTLPILKKSEFQLIEMPVPPSILQQRFRSIVEKCREFMIKSKSSYDHAGCLLNSLTQRAFRGGP